MARDARIEAAYYWSVGVICIAALLITHLIFPCG